MKLQRLILFLVVSFFALFFVACGGSEEASPDAADTEANSSDSSAAEEASEEGAEAKTLTFSPLALSIPALKGLSEGVEAVGAGMGYDIIIVDPNFDAPTQAQQLNELITTGRTNAAWVISVNPGAMKEVVDLAQENDVVLVLNGVPEDYGYDGMQSGVTFARINYEEFGGAVGEILGQCINERLGGTAEVIFLQSAEGTAGKQEIETTMEAKLLETAPNAEIVATAIVSERAEGQNTVSQLLQAHPNAKAVMTTNDEGGLGALGAFKAAGLEIPCLVDAGGNDEVLEAVSSGEMYGAAALEFEADMMQTFAAVASMLEDPSAPGEQLEVPVARHTTE